MSLLLPVSRQAIIDAALVVVAKSRGSAAMLNLDGAARQLLFENPGGDITLQDLKDAMLSFATRHRVPVETG